MFDIIKSFFTKKKEEVPLGYESARFEVIPESVKQNDDGIITADCKILDKEFERLIKEGKLLSLRNKSMDWYPPDTYTVEQYDGYLSINAPENK